VKYDNWADFLTLLNEVNVRERYFILDLLSVSAVLMVICRAWNVIICLKPLVNKLKLYASH